MIAWFAKLPLVEKVGWSVLGIVILGFVLVVFYAGLRKILGKYLEWQGVQTLEIPERVGLKLEFIKTAAQILGGAFFILTIIIAYWNYRISQEKNTTDLFTKAVEQLGSDKLEVRLGGIYSLERIARESEKDHGPIMEVLTAYVRANAPWQPKNKKKSKGQPAATEKPPTFFDLLKLEKVISKIKPRTDIQAILTVIGRRKYTFMKGEAQRLDLSQTDLRGADLWKAHLEGINFIGAHLEGARLLNAHLEWANFLVAHLEGADLIGAHLKETNFNMTHLEGACLIGAHLERAGLIGTFLQNAYLSGANLQESVLTGAHLDEANLGNAHLEDASFLYTQLKGASLDGAHLEGAHMSEALGLTKKQISKAITDGNTNLPEYLIESVQIKPDSK